MTQRRVTFSECLFYGFYLTLTIVKGFGLYEGMLLYEVGVCIALFFFLWKLLSEQYSTEQFVLTMLLLFLGVTTWKISGKMGGLFNITLLLGLRGVQQRRLIQVSAVVWSLLFSIQCFLTMSGIRTEQIFRIHRKLGIYLVRWSMGFTHPNVFHITYFVLIVFILNSRKMREKELRLYSIVAMAGNIVVFCYSVSYTGGLLVTFYLMTNLILQSGCCKNERFYAISKYVSYAVPISCFFFSVGAPILLSGKVFDFMNKILKTRLELSRQYILGQGIRLFGSANMETADATITVDSSYVYMLVHYGLVYFVLFAVLLELAVVFYWKKKEFGVISVLLACSVSGVTEQYMANTSFKNITIIFIATMVYNCRVWNDSNSVDLRNYCSRKLSDMRAKWEKVCDSVVLRGVEDFFYLLYERFRVRKGKIVAWCLVTFLAGGLGYIMMVSEPSAIYASLWDCDRKEGEEANDYIYDVDLTTDPNFDGWILSDRDAQGRLYEFNGLTVTSEYYRRAVGRGISLIILVLWIEVGISFYMLKKQQRS